MLRGAVLGPDSSALTLNYMQKEELDGKRFEPGAAPAPSAPEPGQAWSGQRRGLPGHPCLRAKLPRLHLGITTHSGPQPQECQVQVVGQGGSWPAVQSSELCMCPQD